MAAHHPYYENYRVIEKSSYIYSSPFSANYSMNFRKSDQRAALMFEAF